MEQFVKIDILGKQYTFKAETEFSHAKEVADLLSKEVRRVELRQPDYPAGYNQMGIVILTALNIANDFIEIKKKNSELLNTISDKSAKLLNKMDDCLNRCCHSQFL